MGQMSSSNGSSALPQPPVLTNLDEFDDEMRNASYSNPKTNIGLKNESSSSFRARLKLKPRQCLTRLRGLVQSRAKISTNSSNENNNSQSSSSDGGTSSTASSPLVVFTSGVLKPKYVCDVTDNAVVANLTDISPPSPIVHTTAVKSETTGGVSLISYYSSNFTNSIKARFGGTGPKTHHIVYLGY
jgi:hypothetical protein